MEPYSLHLAGVLLTFVLKATAGFALALVLAYLLPSPRHRFLTWLGFLLGVGLAWIDLLAGEVLSIISVARGGGILNASMSGAGEHLMVPATWGLWIARVTLFLAAIYVTGAATLLAFESSKHFRLRALLKQGQQPSPQLNQLFQRICREFNVRRCRLVILPHLKSPATVHWWRPWVILPAVCETLVETSQLENALRHELIHTLRCDYLWATVGDLLCALLFFHPAVWHARRRLIMQRELACDLAVVEAQPGQRADYADSLTHFVRLTLQQRASLSVHFAPPASFLGTRIRCILTEPEPMPGWKRAVADVVFVGFVLVFASMSPALSVSFAVSPQPQNAIQSGPTQYRGTNQPPTNTSLSPVSDATPSPSAATPDRSRADHHQAPR